MWSPARVALCRPEVVWSRVKVKVGNDWVEESLVRRWTPGIRAGDRCDKYVSEKWYREIWVDEEMV